MDRKQANQALVLAGSTLAANGMLLLLSPGRFATLRQATWLPDGVNAGLDWLARHGAASRSTGLAAALIGLALLGAGVLRTRPIS